ncbi:MAG: EAL domain-containing protein, partial [Trueperaceae bacterium]
GHAYRLRHQDDSYRWMHDAMRPRFLDDGTFAGYVGSVIDVHEHRLRTDVLRERERRLERMAAFRRSVLDLVEEGLSAPSAESLHQRVLEHAVQVIPGAEAGAILERVPDGDDFRFDAAVGYDLQRLRAVRIPASAVAFGEGMERRSPRIVPTPDVHPSVSPETAHILREYGRVGAIQAALVVPIVVDGRKVAHLTLDSFASADAFHDESVDMARIFAGQVAALFQRRALERELRRIAFEDPLTRLPNRAWFKDRLARTIGEVDGMTRRMAVVFVDLDNLKPVNDSLGHWAGDEVLRQVAARLRRCARPDDVLARLGGDEFTLMRVDPSVGREARALAERIVHAFREPIDLGDHRVAVTASIGIAVHPSDGADADDLLRHADIAMYHAKLRGKNAFAFFAAEMQAAPLERLMLEQALREALDRDEFVLEYQPRVDLRDGRIVAVEALVRWEHPTRGRVPPGAFMPLAETTALVHPLGRHILQMAARQAAAWRAEGFRDLRVAVNLSTRQVQHRDLVGEVREVLANAHLEADALEFEVLESAAMSDVTGSIATLQALKRLGARVALDDFGTGYSSLAYLRDLPIDALKIDRTFVARLGHAASRGNDLAIVRAIGSLGRELGLQVVAEGIERRAQVAMARDAGCTQAQGFLLSRPLPAAKVTPLLRAGRLQP